MASAKQIAANRRNALKSTGPRTPEGKAHTRLNALHHGLRARTKILPGESLKELENLRKMLLLSVKPQTAEQRTLVDRMAFAKWKLRFWERTESRLLQEESTRSNLVREIVLSDRFSQRQAHYERAFMDAYEQLIRLTRRQKRK